MTFKPSIGFDGFKVISSFNIEDIQCPDLDNDIYQLAIVLHPPEVINEKFLIRLRDCVLKLPETHSLKKWMKWVGKANSFSEVEQKRQKFISEILTSQFNLITDAKVKNEIISILYEIPENTLAEQLLKSYLYLMIGNVTRSDNILRSIVNTTPRKNWAKTEWNGSFYHKLGKEYASQILSKLGRHPADRKSFELFGLYLQSFYNEASITNLAGDINTSDVETNLALKYVEGLAPAFVRHLRISRMNENQRMKALRNVKQYPIEEQAYWIWTFFNIDPLISEKMMPELKKIEMEDELWFIYLMNNERLFDLYSKNAGRSFLPGRRPFLKESLQEEESFMMSLYKLIEFGDINQQLVNQATNQLINE